MMKISILIKGGLALTTLLAMFLTAGQQSAFGYAGIVKLKTATVLTGVTEIRIVSGVVNQTSPANLIENMNYNKTNDGTYDIYNIYDSPAAATSVLLLKGGAQYSILGASMGTTVPPTKTYDAARFYKTGKPTPPIVADDGILTGYETAKVVWALDPDYEYNGVFFMLSSAPDFATLFKDSDGKTVTSVGSKNNYAFGEYVDSRKIDSGKTYYIGLYGTVAGVPQSDYSTNKASKDAGINGLVFTTKAGGGVMGPADFSWIFKKPSTGINTIAFPFYPNSGDITAKDANFTVQKNATFTVRKFIDEINRQAGAPVVTVFGWYDESNQQHVGLTSIPNGDLKGVLTATGVDPVANKAYTPAQILDLPVKPDRAYQVTVNQDKKTVTLQGYKQ